MFASDGRSSYLVECYWPDVSEQKVRAAAERTRKAVRDLRDPGHPVEFVGTIYLPADETVFCLFEGRETDVRSVSVQTGVPFERVLESLCIDGDDEKAERT